jgi:hypothetical protein
MTQQEILGHCLCGAVLFALHPPVRNVAICHCRQCARWTGYAVAATAVAPENLAIRSGADEIKWFSSSTHAERGFCRICGSSLFWKPADGTRIAVLAGTLDPPTGLTVAAHIFVDDKSDFYEIVDDAPQYSQSGKDVTGLLKHS